MNKHLVALLGAVAVSCLAAVPALADTAPAIEATPIPRPPKPNFTSMLFETGTWKCSTKSARRPTADVSTQTTSLDPSGYWLVTKSEDAGTSWFPYASTGTDLVTYDKDTSLWVDMFTDTLGDYMYSTSPGWTGAKMVWTTRSFSPTATTKSVSLYTVTKTSDTEYHTSYSFVTAKGTSVGVTGTCTKT